MGAVRFFGIGFVLALGACSSPKPLDFAMMNGWSECNFKSSIVASKQEGDPLSLAIAVLGMCKNEELVYRNSIAEQRDHAFADRHMQQLRKTAIETNVATIVKARAGSYGRL